ncbi:MAG TPA: FHA domain-containing protein [Usitatibacter sp.]|nr:FHA domain-containing protein [Usitatibacter sp.]
MAARIVVSCGDDILCEVELTRAVTVVGRHPDCDVVIDHPAISGRHMLLRVVNRTVYVEDLASTNGTRVNGIATSHQVVHHLDLIEVGRHRVHFFDDSMMVGRVGNLESTVLTDYERTMLAANVAAQAAPSGAVEAAAQPAQRDERDLSRTQAIARNPALRVEGDAPAAGTNGAALALRVTAGERAGQLIALDRANTMIGTAGGDSALVVRRGAGYFLARFGGTRPPRLNADELEAGSHPIGIGDRIEVGGSRFEVIQPAQRPQEGKR